MRFCLEWFLRVWGVVFAAIAIHLLVVGPGTLPDVTAHTANGSVVLHDGAVNVKAALMDGEPLAVSAGGDYLFYRVPGTVHFYKYDVFNRTKTTIESSADGPIVSPTGDHIAYVSDRRSYADIHLIDVQTGDENPLQPFDWNEHLPHWSADGRYLAFIVGKGNTRDLYVYDVEAGIHQQVTALAAGRADQPAWHPARPLLAYLIVGVDDSGVYLLDVETAQGQRISDIGEQVTAIFDVDWRIDGDIAMEFRDVDFGRTQTTIRVPVVDAEGS
ncbi:MAG: hypothetical protein AAFR56_01950 [Chloroflexota bacterium]